MVYFAGFLSQTKTRLGEISLMNPLYGKCICENIHN